MTKTTWYFFMGEPICLQIGGNRQKIFGVKWIGVNRGMTAAVMACCCYTSEALIGRVADFKNGRAGLRLH